MRVAKKNQAAADFEPTWPKKVVVAFIKWASLTVMACIGAFGAYFAADTTGQYHHSGIRLQAEFNAKDTEKGHQRNKELKEIDLNNALKLQHDRDKYDNDTKLQNQTNGKLEKDLLDRKATIDTLSKQVKDLVAAKVKLEKDQVDRNATIDTLTKQVEDLKGKLKKDQADSKGKLPQKALPKATSKKEKANSEFESLRERNEYDKSIAAQRETKKPNAASPPSKQAAPPRSALADEPYGSYDTYVGKCHEVRGTVLTFWHHEGNGIGRAWESGRKCDSFTIDSACKFVVNGKPGNSVAPGTFIFVKAKGTVVYHCTTIPTEEEALSARAYASK